MKAHIVIWRKSGSRILDRLVGHLERLNGWPVGTKPDPQAEVNIYFPYLEWRKHRMTSTPSAAWFTHREVGTPAKVQLYDQAAQEIGLCVTPARMYAVELQKIGPTVHIPHPIELDKFIPVQRPANPRPVIGVSGWVYKGGRKGEALVKRLYDQESGRWDIQASGRGWPIPYRQYPWREMENYYRSLDVFLCTSFCEGGPVTMFEALACGIPVVIPHGVGQCDDLPETSGIYHYQVNDYTDMLRALESAVRIKHTPAVLRAYVDQYTPERWAKSWNDVLEAWLYPQPQHETLPDWRGRCGIFVVAFGGPSRKCARRLVKSCQKHMPGVPVAVITDTPLGVGEIWIEHPDGEGIPGSDIGGRSAKTRIYDLAPQEWQYIQYLDADCELVAPVPLFFDLLQDGWELVFCTSPGKYYVIRNMRRPDNQDECGVTYDELGSEELLQLQGGVFAFRRNQRTARMMRAWHTEWQRWGKRDQAALLRALYKNPLRMYLLNTRWNTSTRYHPREHSAGVLHHQTEARRHRGIVQGRCDSREAWAAVARANLG